MLSTHLPAQFRPLTMVRGWLAPAVGAAVLGYATRAHAMPKIDGEAAARVVEGLSRPIQAIAAGVSLARGAVDGLLGSMDFGALASFHPGEHATECSSNGIVGVAFLVLATLLFLSFGRMRHQLERRKLDLARNCIEQGLEVPDGLLGQSARSDLRRGSTLTLLGMGIAAYGALFRDTSVAALGVVPAFVGVGYLVAFWLWRQASSSSRGPRTHHHR